MSEENSLPKLVLTIDSGLKKNLTRLHRFMNFNGKVMIVYGVFFCLLSSILLLLTTIVNPLLGSRNTFQNTSFPGQFLLIVSSVITILLSISIINIGIRLHKSGFHFKNFGHSGLDTDMASAIDWLTRSFFIQYVISIISTVIFGLYVILIIFIIISGFNGFFQGMSQNLLNGSKENSEGIISKWTHNLSNKSRKTSTLSSGTINILQKLPDLVSIKVCFSEDLPPELKDTVNSVQSILKSFKKFGKKNLAISWEDPGNSNETSSMVKELGIPEIQMQSYEKSSVKIMKVFLGIVVQYADRKEIIPFVQNTRTLEYDIALAISKVIRDSNPTIGILRDTSTSDNTESNPLIDTLKNSYMVNYLSPSSGQSIASNLQTLIVTACKDISDQTLFEIDQFFMRGGKLIVLADPFKINFTNGIKAIANESKIFKLLNHYGVEVEKSFILDLSCGQVSVSQKTGPYPTYTNVAYPFFIRLSENGFSSDNPAFSSLHDVIFPWASPVSLSTKDSNSVKTIIIARSSPQSWTVSENINLEPNQPWRQSLKQDSAKHPYDIAIYYRGSFTSYFSENSTYPASVKFNSNGHMVVIGDEDFVLGDNAISSNVSLLENIVDWLTIDDNLVEIKAKTAE